MIMKKTGGKNTGTGKTTPVTAALKGLGVCAFLTILMCALSAMLIVKGILPQGLDAAAGSVSAAIASFGGALLTTKQAKNKKMICALGMSLAYALMLLLGNLLFVESSPAGALRVVLPVGVAGILALLIGNRKQTKHSTRRK